MPRDTKPQTNFTGGEWSSTADARIDIDKYNNSCALIQNFWNHHVGGLFFRPGTIYAATTKTPSAGKVNLLSFVYSSTQAYAIEAGDQYFRFYTNNGQLQSMGSPVELTTPYVIGDVFSLRSAQDSDTKYIVSTLGTYQMQKLIRTSATAFAINPVTTIGGPFRGDNIQQACTITASSDTGGTTLTATVPAWGSGNQYTQGSFVTNSGTTYVCKVPNTSSASFAVDLAAGLWAAANVFNAGHVGALWKVKSGTVVITVYTSGTQVSGYVQNNPDGSAGNLATSLSATATWAEGAFSTYRGWPTCCVFYEQRLYYGMGNFFFGSTIQAYDDFSAGTQLATDAVDYQLLEELQNNIAWISGSALALKAGTTDGTFYISSGTQNTPITPTNILAQKHTTWGSSNLASSRLFDAIYYASRDNMQIRELKWFLDIEADRSIDMTLVADHILFNGGGGTMIDAMSFPIPRVLVPRVDGQLAVLTRNIEQEVQGWARTIMGTSSGAPGILESLVVTPTATGSDQIWASVYRVINGTPQRFIEYFTPERFSNPWDAVRMDAASVYNVPITMTGATKSGTPGFCIVTAPAHGLSNGNQIKIDGVVGMTQLNGNFYKVVNVTTNNFGITDLSGNPIDSSGFSAYVSGGQIRKMVTTITGLSYLNGETVVVSCDGGLPGKQQTFTVSGGSITLPTPAAVVNVGLPYQGLIQLQKFSGTAMGKMTRIYLATVRVFNSLGLQVGTDLTRLSTYQFSGVNDPLGHAPALVTNDLEIRWQTTWSKTDQVYLVQNQPLPLFICGAFFRDELEEA